MSEEIVKFLKAHPLISIRRLELKLDIPETMLSHALKKQRNIPGKYWLSLEKELKKYGYKKIN